MYLDELHNKQQGTKKLAIFADFDECVAEQHLTRMVTEAVLKGNTTPEIERAKGDNSIEGLRELCRVYEGMHLEEFKQIVRSTVEQATPRKNFMKFLNFVVSAESLDLYFVSSGFSWVIHHFLETSSSRVATNIHVVATSLLSDEKGSIMLPYALFGVEEKREVVQYFRNLNAYQHYCTVGHSSGDYELVKAGNEGLRLCFDDSPQLHEVSDVVIADWDWGEVIAHVLNILV